VVILLSLGYRLGSDGEARVRNRFQPPVPGRAPLVLPDALATLFRDRIRPRRRPHVPHAAPAPLTGRARALLRRRDQLGAKLPPQQRYLCPRAGSLRV